MYLLSIWRRPVYRSKYISTNRLFRFFHGASNPSPSNARKNVTCAWCDHGVRTDSLEQCKVDSRFAPSPWETSLLCKDVSHCLGSDLESARQWDLTRSPFYTNTCSCCVNHSWHDIIQLPFMYVTHKGIVITFSWQIRNSYTIYSIYANIYAHVATLMRLHYWSNDMFFNLDCSFIFIHNWGQMLWTYYICTLIDVDIYFKHYNDVNSLHKGPATRKMVAFDGVIIMNHI